MEVSAMAVEETGATGQPRADEGQASPKATPDESAPSATEPQVVPLGALGTRDLLVSLLGVLASKAWEGMGLVPNPATNKIQKDIASARTAIDAYAAILDVVRAQVEDQPRREMESLLTTLRLNFVEKSTSP
jgi:hypothetical protein